MAPEQIKLWAVHPAVNDRSERLTENSDGSPEAKRESWQLLTTDKVNEPMVPAGFSELWEIRFVASAPKMKMLIDGEEIDEEKIRLVSSGKQMTEWRWKPKQYAGVVRAEIWDSEGKHRGVFRLDVSAHPKKLGSELFKEMLSDILHEDPTLLLGYEPARFQFGAVGEEPDALVEFVRLQNQWEELDRSISTIQRDPSSILRPRRRFVPLREARRADIRTLLSAYRNPAALAALKSDAQRDPSSSSGEPIFDTPAVERQLDSPVNRAALWMLRALRRRCEELPDRLSRVIRKEPQSAKDTRTPLTKRESRWQQTLLDIGIRLRKAERRRPFSEVERSEITAAGLNAIAGSPLYARFWRLGWRALRQSGDRHEPVDLLPLPPTWEIYERWCVAEMKKLLPAWLGKSRQEWFELNRRPSDRNKIDERKWVLDLNANHRLILQSQTHFSNKRDNRKGQPQHEGWSVSQQRRPDIVLLREQDGCLEDFLVLDAKYTAANIVKEVGETAHAYQDGLRWGMAGKRPTATIILAPNAEEVADPGWLTDPEFVTKHRIGVVELRPGAKPPDWLRDFVTGVTANSAREG